MRILPILISLLFLLMPLAQVVNGQPAATPVTPVTPPPVTPPPATPPPVSPVTSAPVSAEDGDEGGKVTTSEIKDYRDIKIDPEGFKVKDPYALPVYDLKSISLLPFSNLINNIFNLYLGNLLSKFNLKEAFALRILFEDIEPIITFIGNLLSIPVTLISLPVLSIGRVIKLPYDILKFLLSAIINPILSIPAHELAILRQFICSLKQVAKFPMKLLKPIDFLTSNPDPMSSFASLDSLSLYQSFINVYSFISPLISSVSDIMSYIPFLNVIRAFFNAYILPLLKIPLSLVSLLAPYAHEPKVNGLLNLVSLPISIPLLILQQLLSFGKDLASVIIMPLLFVLRIPLTPLLILFNFIKHSLEGFKQFVQFTSLITFIPTLIFLAPVVLFALIAFIVSIPLSILLAPIAAIAVMFIGIPLLLMLIPTLIMLGIGLILGILLSFVLPILLLFGGFFVLVLLYAIFFSGFLALIPLVFLAYGGLALGALIGFFGPIVAVAILVAIVGLGLGCLVTIFLAIIGQALGLLAALVFDFLCLVGGGLVGLFIGFIIGLFFGGPFGAIVGAIVGGLIGLIPAVIVFILALLVILPLSMIGYIALSLILSTVFLSLPIIAPFIAIFLAPILGVILSWVGFFIGVVLAGIFILLMIVLFPLLFLPLTLLMIPVLMISITAIGAIGGTVVWHSILAAITGAIATALAPHTIILSIIAIVLLVPLIILAVISVISPELFRVLIPPEFIALLARAGNLPKDIARIINGLIHVPLDLMKAIAVLDAVATVEDGGDGGTEDPGEIEHYAMIVCGNNRKKDDWFNNNADQMYNMTDEDYDFTDVTYMGQDKVPTKGEVRKAMRKLRNETDENDVVFIYLTSHGARGTCENGTDDEEIDEGMWVGEHRY